MNVSLFCPDPKIVLGAHVSGQRKMSAKHLSEFLFNFRIFFSLSAACRTELKPETDFWTHLKFALCVERDARDLPLPPIGAAGELATTSERRRLVGARKVVSKCWPGPHTQFAIFVRLHLNRMARQGVARVVRSKRRLLDAPAQICSEFLISRFNRY